MSNEIAYAELAARNSKVAVDKTEATRNELLDRIVHLENLVNNNTNKLVELEQKYNLLLTARFDGRATEPN